MINLIATVVLITATSMTQLDASTQSVGQTKSCRNQSAQICWYYFQQSIYGLNLTSIAIDDVIPSWDRVILMPLCQAFFNYSKCMSPVLEDYCGAADQLKFEGARSAWQYMCENSTEEFLNYSSCFRRPDVRTPVSTCNDTLAVNLVTITNRDDYCSEYDTFVTCVSSVIKPECGADAAVWNDNYVTLLLTPLLSYLSCPGWGNSTDADWSAASIVIASFIGITLFVMIVIVVALVILVVHRRKQQSAAPPSSMLDCPVVNSNDPPSYCEPYVVYEPTSTSGTSEGDTSAEASGQFLRLFVDPLTGMRQNGGLVGEADLPYKVCLSFPPLYADGPPPSFDESFPVAGDVILQTTGDVETSMAAVNEAFSLEDGDDSVTQIASLRTDSVDSSHV